MKPPLKPSSKLPAAAALLVAATLAGCGQRGPLYLPGQPGAPTAPAKSAPAAPAAPAAPSTPAPTDSNSSTPR